VDLDTFIVGAFCTIDDALRELPASHLRTRGPAPVLADSEVLTLEVVGEFLGLDQDVAIYRYFRRHCGHFFPALGRVHRTTFVRQALRVERMCVPKAFQSRSRARAKVLLERDRRSGKIEIGNAQKEGGSTLTNRLQSGPGRGGLAPWCSRR
jgi:hypothetical protein